MNTNSKLIRAVFGICCLCVLSGCGDANISAAKAAIEETLIDPSSVEYRNVVSFTEGIVCGEVNARNRFGGYTGFKDFIFINGNEPDPFYPRGRVKIEGLLSDEIEAWCNNKTNKYLTKLESDLERYSKGCKQPRQSWESESILCDNDTLISRINLIKTMKK